MENKAIIVNLKMAMEASDVSSYLKKLDVNLPKNVVICPSSIYIPYFLNKSYSVGIQNIFFRSKGEFTGEISPSQVKSMGIEYVLVGHPERRMYFNEDNDVINRKILESLKHDLKVILFVGESIEDKNMFRTPKVLKEQILSALEGVKIDKMSKIYITYEPLWTVETNKVASNYEIEKAVRFIKEVVKEYFEFSSIKVLYGGGVSKGNINGIQKIESLDGILLENSSCDADEFLKIIEVVVNQ